MKRKILLIDDEEIFRRPLAKTILSAGFLVEALDLPESRVAVERNLAIVRKPDFAGTVLGDGDRIEIVTFVGGG